jgi:hypothetical protein
LPSGFSERRRCSTIAGDIARAFSAPIIGVRYWCPTTALAYVHVPKAAMHVDNLPELRKYKIGCPWKVAAVKAKTVPKLVNHAPDNQFRFGITRPNRRHNSRSLGFSESFRHVPILEA